jgi:hypothetical protein
VFDIQDTTMQNVVACPSTRNEIISIRQQLQELISRAVSKRESRSLPLRTIWLLYITIRDRKIPMQFVITID